VVLITREPARRMGPTRGCRGGSRGSAGGPWRLLHEACRPAAPSSTLRLDTSGLGSLPNGAKLLRLPRGPPGAPRGARGIAKRRASQSRRSTSPPKWARIGGRLRFPDKHLKAILAAPGLEFTPWGRRPLATAIEKAAWWFRLYRSLDEPRLVPSRDARRAHRVASALDKALATLTDEQGLLAVDLIAWAGFEADEAEPPAPGAPSGFERANRTVHGIRWLRDQLQSWSRRTRTAPAGKRGPLDRSARRRAAIAILAPAYDRAFGRPMGLGREGPAIRFLRAFFKEIGDRPHATTLLKLIRAVRRDSV